MKDVIRNFLFLILFFFFLVELSILTRESSSTNVSILNFDQVDKFVKTFAPTPEKKWLNDNNLFLIKQL